MIRGAGRFAGYGNVRVTPDRPHRGWQLTCSKCGVLSAIVHRTGESYPPKMLFQMFRDMNWKVGNSNSKGDICPQCLEKAREQRKQERKQYVNGSADRLLDTIRQLDRLISSSVTVDYGERVPEIEAQLRSLFETAYLCNIFPKGLIGEFKDFFREGDKSNEASVTAAQESTSAPEPPLPQLESELVEKVLSGEMSISKAREIYHAEEPEPEPPPPPAPVQIPEGHRMSPRTAEFLAETRRKISQLRNHDATS